MTETDLLVVGGGVAGASTAIHAADLGARVTLIEKADRLGGNCTYSAGNLLQLEGPDSLEHLRAMAFGRTPDDVLAAYRDGLSGVRSWLSSLGASTSDVDPRMLPNCWPNLPGSKGVTYYTVDGAHGGGSALWSVLAHALAARNIEVRTSTRLCDLQETDGRVAGATVRRPDGAVETIEASHGVVLATGGFEGSSELTETYLPISPLAPVGIRENTGDGLLAAQRVGASLWHMSNFYGFWTFVAPQFESAFALLFFSPRHLMVDADGRRFLAETGREAHDVLRTLGDVLPGNPNRPSLPVYLVCDSDLLARGPLSRFANPNGYRWSDDNTAEIEAGWIRSASSPTELATMIGVPPDTLESTIARYNSLAAAGHDGDFGRPSDSMAPVDPSALFAIELRPGVATTSGGPRRDSRARILRSSGEPIPGLFGAGGTGGIWGHLTEHGGGLTDAIVFGGIAARAAVKTSGAGLPSSRGLAG